MDIETKIKSDIAYLAINDDVIVDKTICENDFCIDTETNYDNMLWVRLSTPEYILTALLTLEDTNINDSIYLTRISGHEIMSSNAVLDIFVSSLYVLEDIIDEYEMEMILDILDSVPLVYYQEKNFLMYAPSKGLIHPWFIEKQF